MDDRERLILQQRAIEALRARITAESYMSVRQVMKRLNLSREKVEELPEEILPYVDHGSPTRRLRRYHPADVLAADARIRAWRRAQQRGEGEAYLAKLRAELEERDRKAMELAQRMTAEVA